MKSSALILATFTLLWPFAASAQSEAPAPSDSAKHAEALFDEANALAAEGKFAEACPKFAESQRLDPGLGTHYNLALCLEKEGKLGSAFRNFREVEVVAKATGKRERADASRQRLDALRGRVSYLVLTGSDDDVTITVDGARVERESWAFYPLDLGPHEITATAPAKRSWHTQVDVTKDGVKIPVEVPQLTVARGETRVITKETSNPKRTIAFAVGGLGVAGVAAGIVTGIMVLDAKSTADDLCTPGCRNQEGVDAVSTGKTLLPINAVAWGVGFAGLAAGAFLFFTSSPKSAEPTARLAPMLSAQGGGASVVGRF